MKIQDFIFFTVLIVLLAMRRPKILLAAGLLSWVLAIPLFAKWVFFTAERLTWYAAAFFVSALIMNLIQERRVS